MQNKAMAGSLLPQEVDGRMGFTISEPSRMLYSSLHQVKKAFAILKTDNEINLALDDEFSNVIGELQNLTGSCAVFQLEKSNGTVI